MTQPVVKNWTGIAHAALLWASWVFACPQPKAQWGILLLDKNRNFLRRVNTQFNSLGSGTRRANKGGGGAWGEGQCPIHAAHLILVPQPCARAILEPAPAGHRGVEVWGRCVGWQAAVEVQAAGGSKELTASFRTPQRPTAIDPVAMNGPDGPNLVTASDVVTFLYPGPDPSPTNPDGPDPSPFRRWAVEAGGRERSRAIPSSRITTSGPGFSSSPTCSVASRR